MANRTLAVRIALVAVGFMLVFAGDCYTPPPPDTSLGVPFRTQPQWDYCGAASVLMWRLYNGMGEVSQDSIYTWMGGSGAGVSPQAIANGASFWANVYDATVDWGAEEPIEYQREFFARQISSINNNTPVIAIVDGGFHAGVINGGTWHEDSATGMNVWNDVKFHDPKGYANRYFSSAAWQSFSVAGYNTYTQIVSNGATYGWQTDYADYGDTVVNSSGGGYHEPFHREAY